MSAQQGSGQAGAQGWALAESANHQEPPRWRHQSGLAAWGLCAGGDLGRPFRLLCVVEPALGSLSSSSCLLNVDSLIHSLHSFNKLQQHELGTIIGPGESEMNQL